MPFKFSPFITRNDLRMKPEWLFVFGDNMQRRGRGGQAREMRGEPNAVGIVTKRAPSMDRRAFFSDDDYAEVAEVVYEAFERLEEHLALNGVVVLPTKGVGTGLAMLDFHAPKIDAMIQNGIEDLIDRYGTVIE